MSALQIISTPITRTTLPNTSRNTLVLADTNIRVPSSDPMNTPSMTGMVKPGSMQPRQKFVMLVVDDKSTEAGYVQVVLR